MMRDWRDWQGWQGWRKSARLKMRVFWAGVFVVCFFSAQASLVQETLSQETPSQETLSQENAPLNILPSLEDPLDGGGSETPIDLTTLIEEKILNNDNFTEDGLSEDGAADGGAVLERLEAGERESDISLRAAEPSSIRLNAVGIDLASSAARGRGVLDFSVLGRQMWAGSDAASVLALHRSLDKSLGHEASGGGRVPSSLRGGLRHVMTARAVPPEGFDAVAAEILEHRFKALTTFGAGGGASEDLAEMVAQLPVAFLGDVRWGAWHEWLALHWLLTRRDAEACRLARDKGGDTLEPVWHRINAFCAIVAGDIDKARFALDALRESGFSSPSFDILMLRLTGQESSAQSRALDQAEVSVLDLVLMDSARITIEREALLDIADAYGGSIASLRYLSDDAIRLVQARRFGLDETGVLLESWMLLPSLSMAASDAVKRLSVADAGEAGDARALGRLDAWQAVRAERDDKAAARLAFEAFMIDYEYSGIESLGLWLAAMEQGDEAERFLLGFASGLASGFASGGTSGTRGAMPETAEAWHALLSFSHKPISLARLEATEAFDAVPLLRASGLKVADIDWRVAALDERDARPLAAQSQDLDYIDLARLQATATKNRPAETLMRAVHVLSGVDLARLNRHDAAYVVGALYQAGLVETAQALVREILVSWGVARHLSTHAP